MIKAGNQRAGRGYGRAGDRAERSPRGASSPPHSCESALASQPVWGEGGHRKAASPPAFAHLMCDFSDDLQQFPLRLFIRSFISAPVYGSTPQPTRVRLACIRDTLSTKVTFMQYKSPSLRSASVMSSGLARLISFVTRSFVEENRCGRSTPREDVRRCTRCAVSPCSTYVMPK